MRQDLWDRGECRRLLVLTNVGLRTQQNLTSKNSRRREFQEAVTHARLEFSRRVEKLRDRNTHVSGTLLIRDKNARARRATLGKLIKLYGTLTKATQHPYKGTLD